MPAWPGDYSSEHLGSVCSYAFKCMRNLERIADNIPVLLCCKANSVNSFFVQHFQALRVPNIM